MSSALRKEVLKQFKSIHKVRKLVFSGDEKTLIEAKIKINENFKKNKSINDPQEIKKLIQFAKDVQRELKTNVVQAVEKEPGVFKVNVNKEILLDNIPFKEDADIKILSNPKCGNRK